MAGNGRQAPTVEDAAYCLAGDPFRLAEANINPITGLSTDYLNHFNEAIMLIELVPQMPECRTELMAWRPLSYHEHFAASRLRQGELAIAAYDLTDAFTRRQFDTVCAAMKATIMAARTALDFDLPPETSAAIASEALARLKPLTGQASAVIHGHEIDERGILDGGASQAAVDAVMAP